MFSTLPKTNFDFLIEFILSVANVFNLNQFKILLFGKDLINFFNIRCKMTCLYDEQNGLKIVLSNIF